MTKCRPLKCRRFVRMFIKFYEKYLVDRFVVNCPNRHGKTKYGCKCRKFQRWKGRPL